jgi:uncharacterized membrane protein YdjX (TVP38/TMEM64 family)
MNFIIEIILQGLIIDFLGKRTRFYFFKILGKEKSLKYLSGSKKKQGSYSMFEQHIMNVIVGIASFCIISFGLVYLLYQLNLL